MNDREQFLTEHVDLTRRTWQLEVLSDPDNPATLGKQLTRKDGTSLDFKGLQELGSKHAVRFAKVMTCLNIGCPLGMGVWEGVPLREVLWLTQPRENLRRVCYHGYHNDDPKQLFRSSLSVGRVLEDPFDLPPVILCYKLNGHWLDSQRGGPVRIVVPEAYGFKSVKWGTHARVLPPPQRWGGDLPGDIIPKDTLGFASDTGRPRAWPMRLGKVHWAALLPGLAPGEYTLRCRTVDEKGHAQPLPRPFRKSG